MTDTRSAAARIDFPGAITIREIAAIHKDLLAKLEAKRPLEIDCSAVTEADISLIQLLLAAEKSGAAIRLVQPYPEAVQQLLARCGLDAPGASLWTADL